MGLPAENIELFNSAHEALTFAYQVSIQAHSRPLMNRLSDTPRPSGKGLAGLDAAAQAGMIRAKVATLGRLFENIIIARYVPRSVPCSCKSTCCKGYKDNPEWMAAIAWLADHMRVTVLKGRTTTGLMRRDYVRRYFMPKTSRLSLDDIAKKHNVVRDTASAHSILVINFFGDQHQKKVITRGQEYLAMKAIDEKLYQDGLVA